MALADIGACISYSGKTSVSSLNAVNQRRQIMLTLNSQSLLDVHILLCKTGSGTGMLRVVSYRLGEAWSIFCFPWLLWASSDPLKDASHLPTSWSFDSNKSMGSVCWSSAILKFLKYVGFCEVSAGQSWCSVWKLQNWYLNRAKFIVVTVFLYELFSQVQSVKLGTLSIGVCKAKRLLGKIYFLVLLWALPVLFQKYLSCKIIFTGKAP